MPNTLIKCRWACFYQRRRAPIGKEGARAREREGAHTKSDSIYRPQFTSQHMRSATLLQNNGQIENEFLFNGIGRHQTQKISIQSIRSLTTLFTLNKKPVFYGWEQQIVCERTREKKRTTKCDESIFFVDNKGNLTRLFRDLYLLIVFWFNYAISEKPCKNSKRCRIFCIETANDVATNNPW